MLSLYQAELGQAAAIGSSISVLLRLLMREGWLIEQETGAAARFHADDNSYVRDPKVFVDKCRYLGANKVPLLKSRQHLRKEEATKIWTQLKRAGWKPCEPLWGANADV